MKEKPIIVNMFGGPGVGKSTAAAVIFSLLKMHDINVELVTEFAKDCTWEKRFVTLEDQYYIWAEQHHRIWRVEKEVNVIVTDSPFLLSLVYGNTTDNFKQTVLELFNDYNNMNFLLQRVTNYTEGGRNETLTEASVIDTAVKDMLTNYSVPYKIIIGDNDGIHDILFDVLAKLKIKYRYTIKDRWDY